MLNIIINVHHTLNTRNILESSTRGEPFVEGNQNFCAILVKQVCKLLVTIFTGELICERRWNQSSQLSLRKPSKCILCEVALMSRATLREHMVP